MNRIPLLHISPTVLGASWAADLFYLLFSPITMYTVRLVTFPIVITITNVKHCIIMNGFSFRYIGKMTKVDSESVDEFALRIQKATSSALHLEASNHTVTDKVK